MEKSKESFSGDQGVRSDRANESAASPPVAAAVAAAAAAVAAIVLGVRLLVKDLREKRSNYFSFDVLRAPAPFVPPVSHLVFEQKKK